MKSFTVAEKIVRMKLEDPLDQFLLSDIFLKTTYALAAIEINHPKVLALDCYSAENVLSEASVIVQIQRL